MNILYKIILFSLFLIEFSLFATAQTTKQIEIDRNEPYVDHLSLSEGSTDMDLLVKFTFDEPNNSLTVNLISYKKLFGLFYRIKCPVRDMLPAVFLLTNQGFMNKLIEDMKRQRTKRVPDKIYPERRGRRLKALL